MAQRRNNGNRKFTIFAILLLPRIKTVADTFVSGLNARMPSKMVAFAEKCPKYCPFC